MADEQPKGEYGEPWRLSEWYGSFDVVDECGLRRIHDDQMEYGTKERITACVSAMAGIPTADLPAVAKSWAERRIIIRALMLAQASRRFEGCDYSRPLTDDDHELIGDAFNAMGINGAADLAALGIDRVTAQAGEPTP